MTTTDTNVSNLIINKLTKAQYDSATKSDTEMYLTVDELISAADVTDALGYTPTETIFRDWDSEGETTDTSVSTLISNTLTKTQYDNATKSDTELYFTTDELISSSDVTTALGYTPANNSLSNLSSNGEDKLRNLKSYELVTETEGFSKIYKEAHSTFDISKFTVVGTPTITNGVVSGFSTTDYIKLIDVLDTSQPFIIESPVFSQDLIDNDVHYIFQTWINYASQGLRAFVQGNNLGLYYKLSGQTSYSSISSSNVITANVKYQMRIEYTGTLYYVKWRNVDTDSPWYNVGSGIINDNTQLEGDNSQIWFGYHNSNPYGFVNGSLDLKQFSITVDGVPVFNGNITGTDTHTIDGVSTSIPYTLSYNNDKYVDSYYRNPVNKLLVSQGYTPYYTIDETNKNFTIPTGKLFKRLSNVENNLEKYELIPEADGYSEIYQEAHSTYDSTKFTVTGSPTIIDGVASGFSSGNYIGTAGVTVTPQNELKFKCRFTITSFSGTQRIFSNSSTGNYWLTVYSIGSIQFKDSDGAISTTQSDSGITVNKYIDLEITCTKTKTIMKSVTEDGVTYINEKDVSYESLSSLSTIYLGRGGTYTGDYLLNGSINLKWFEIISDGVPVFRGNQTGTDTYMIDGQTVTIPYTLSSSNEKYVDSYYRPHVNKLLISQGYTPYYTIDEVNKNFTISTGKLYKLAKTISTKVDGYPKHYIVNGRIMNTSADSSLSGYGTATVILYPSGIAEVHFGCKVETSGTSSTGWASGINRDLLHNLDSNIPVITPITGGVIYMYKSNGSMNTDLCGYGGTSVANGQFWTIARVYQTNGAVGGYPSSALTAGMMFYGTLYGTYTVGTEG